jgi:hypothetical protein
MPPVKNKLTVEKVPLSYEPHDIPMAFPKMPILYLELLENKKKVKPELKYLDYEPPTNDDSKYTDTEESNRMLKEEKEKRKQIIPLNIKTRKTEIKEPYFEEEKQQERTRPRSQRIGEISKDKVSKDKISNDTKLEDSVTEGKQYSRPKSQRIELDEKATKRLQIKNRLKELLEDTSIKADESETSKVEVHKVDTIEVEVSDTSKVEVPRVEVHDAPKVEIPKVEVHDAPKVEVPRAEVPRAEVPRAEVPKVEVPDISDVPKVEFELPRAKTPEIQESRPPLLSEIKDGNINYKGYKNITRLTKAEEEEENSKRELLFKFDLLKKSYPGSSIPEFTVHSDYSMMLKTYEQTVRRLSLDSSVEKYKKYLLAGFMLIEFLLGNVLKIQLIQGYTQQQILDMNSYEKLLIELGEKSYIPGGSKWPVEIRLLGVAFMNAIMFIVTKLITKATGSNLLSMINSLNSNVQSSASNIRPKRKMNGPSINLNDF